VGGFDIPVTGTNKIPSYVVVTPEDQENWIWASNGNEAQDLQAASSVPANARQATCWYSASSKSFDIDLNFTEGNSHQDALYFLDWDDKEDRRCSEPTV
jgi:hypothetical protein